MPAALRLPRVSAPAPQRERAATQQHGLDHEQEEIPAEIGRAVHALSNDADR